MSERNLELEIDGLKQQLSEIKELLTKPTAEPAKTIKIKMEGDEKPEFIGHIHKMAKCKTFEHKSPEIVAVLDRAEDRCAAEESTGCISYVGVFSSGDRQSTWISEERNTDKLFRRRGQTPH